MNKAPITTDSELNEVMAQELLKRVARLQDQTIDLAIRAKEAREFLDWHCETVKASWVDWMKQSGQILEHIRLARLAIGTESKLLLAECGDVRKFFLADEHTTEINRLREFIELAERLKKLKDDGTLDKLADTILKL